MHHLYAVQENWMTSADAPVPVSVTEDAEVEVSTNVSPTVVRSEAKQAHPVGAGCDSVGMERMTVPAAQIAVRAKLPAAAPPTFVPVVQVPVRVGAVPSAKGAS